MNKHQFLPLVCTWATLLFTNNLHAQLTCNGLVADIVGTEQAETIVGTEQDDVIVALGGNDTIHGNGGMDTICGGEGDDEITGGTGNDWISGDNGEDTITGNQGEDTLLGGADNDTIRGSKDNDVIDGGPGEDHLHGGTGDDFIKGGPDNDTILGHTGNDTILGSKGNDDLFGGDGDDTIFAGWGDDTVSGDAGNDTISGHIGNDDIKGGPDNDKIDGGDGNDTLRGSKGDDIIDGGAGNDVINGGVHDELDTCFSESSDNGTPAHCEQLFSDPSTRDLSGYELVFSDDFDGTALDSSNWNTGLLWGPYVQINAEEQMYIDTLGMHANESYSPFDVSNGTLKITAVPKSSENPLPVRPAQNDPVWGQYLEYRFNAPKDGNPGYLEDEVDYLSGIITSYESFKMTHGYVEARVKLPIGKGLWPAFWLLNAHYVKNSPEIDVMEFLGEFPEKVYQTYHYFDETGLVSTPTHEIAGIDWTRDFHTYGVAWSPKEIVWYIDGVEVHKVTDANYLISNQSMYLLANLAVGGNWPGSPDSTTPFPATYEIDYIRAYKKKLSPQLDLAADYQLMFFDEFTGTSLDTAKWNTAYLWGPYHAINGEEQYYVDANGTDADKSYSPFSVANGVLTITADLSSESGSDVPPVQLPGVNDTIWSENPEFQQGPYAGAPEYTSGVITSYDAFQFVNGYAEIRAQLPAGDGLWPAFWLLNAYYVGTLPEIDILELIGENPDIAHHTFHRSDNNGTPIKTEYSTSLGNPPLGYSAGFHTYGVHWQPGKITWYIDGVPVHTFEESVPLKNDAYQAMYVIANLAVGGSFNTQAVDPSALPASYVIDYIRVYQEKPVPE